MPKTVKTTKPKKYKKVKNTGNKKPAKVPRYLLTRQGDTRDFLKITMHRQITKGMMLVASDQSMSHTILNNPMNEVSIATNNASNLLYHTDFSRLNALYKQYKVSCIVYKISRPNVNFCYNNTTPNQTQSIQLPTTPWGTKVLHTTISHVPDAITNVCESSTPIAYRMNTIAPNSWRECCDDGAKLFKMHGYKRHATRVWKPVGDFERRWRYNDSALEDQELCRGALHLRVEKDHPVDLTDKTGTGNNWNYMSSTVIFDIYATVYMQYKNRQ